jgi:F-type H+-transporting ATPase subunit b
MTFNPWTFLFEVINFVALAYVLHRLLYRPLHEAIDRRREEVRRKQAEAEKAREEADAIKQRLEGKLAELELRRQETISQARAQAEVERKNILDAAERAVERRQEEFRLALERDRDEMLQKLSGEIVTHALNLAERLLQQSANSTLQTQLEKHLVETLDAIPPDQRDRLRRDWQAEDRAWLERAAEPDVDTLKPLAEVVTRVAGKVLTLDVRNNPALISGARLRIGGHLWDASIAGQLEEARLPSQEIASHV